MRYTVEEIKDKVRPIAIRYGVDSVSLFGSYARGDADNTSDMDFLVLKGDMKSLLAYCGMIADLEDAFHCHVDLVVKSAIKDSDFMTAVETDEVPVYARNTINKDPAQYLSDDR